jgi:hypothetical protein
MYYFFLISAIYSVLENFLRQNMKKTLCHSLWKDGARVHIEANESTGNMFTLYGIGFQPNEMLSFISYSGRERMPFKHNVDSTGCITIMFNRATIGKKGGEAQISLTRSKNSAKAILNYF